MNRIIDRQTYANLLAEIQPVAIETEEENERMLAEVEKLMSLGEDLTPEQEQLLKLLVALIEQFEDKHYQLKRATPHEVLNELMLARGLKQSALVGILGSKGVTSEVVNGKRGISKAQAKALGEFFHVSPDLFL
ncbi:MAG: transcriptional regulator [Nostocaceae cyanobacterium]|nr:transcriptional regulator [Nostocaceae cyanobacterium]